MSLRSSWLQRKSSEKRKVHGNAIHTAIKTSDDITTTIITTSLTETEIKIEMNIGQSVEGGAAMIMREEKNLHIDRMQQ